MVKKNTKSKIEDAGKFNHSVHERASMHYLGGHQDDQGTMFDDVDVDGLADGQVLAYDEATLTWLPSTPSSGGISTATIDALNPTDVKSTLQYWSGDPAFFTSAVSLDPVSAGAGKMGLNKFRVVEDITVTKMALYVSAADTSQGSSFVGVYTAAGARVADSVEIGGVGGALRTIGYKEVAFNASAALTAGLYYAAFLVSSAVGATDDDTTLVAMSTSGGVPNLDSTGANARMSYEDNSTVEYTTLPTSFTPSNAVASTAIPIYWFGLV